jgi:hypothetical protein
MKWKMLVVTALVMLAGVALPMVSGAGDRTECQYITSDPDGDGWGWENDQSCTMPDFTIDLDFDIGPTGPIGPINFDGNIVGPLPGYPSIGTITGPIDVIATDDNGRPYCISADSDPDGDGWGWEYDRSCVVGG